MKEVEQRILLEREVFVIFFRKEKSLEERAELLRLKHSEKNQKATKAEGQQGNQPAQSEHIQKQSSDLPQGGQGQQQEQQSVQSGLQQNEDELVIDKAKLFAKLVSYLKTCFEHYVKTRAEEDFYVVQELLRFFTDYV